MTFWEFVGVFLVGVAVGFAAGFILAGIGIAKAAKRIEWKDGTVSENKRI